jgi:hypothetical protein
MHLEILLGMGTFKAYQEFQKFTIFPSEKSRLLYTLAGHSHVCMKKYYGHKSVLSRLLILGSPSTQNMDT